MAVCNLDVCHAAMQVPFASAVSVFHASTSRLRQLSVGLALNADTVTGVMVLTALTQLRLSIANHQDPGPRPGVPCTWESLKGASLPLRCALETSLLELDLAVFHASSCMLSRNCGIDTQVAELSAVRCIRPGTEPRLHCRHLTLHGRAVSESALAAAVCLMPWLQVRARSSYALQLPI